MPTPPDGWSLVRVELALASNADLLIDRNQPGSAQTPGSAFVGTVVDQPAKTAATTTTTKQQRTTNNSRRVVADPVIPCRHCERCRRGLAQHCLARRELGVRGLEGCWAEYLILPNDAIIDVPSHIPDSAAVFVHDVARVIHLDRILPASSTVFVSVIGAGAPAIIAAAVLETTKPKTRLLSNDQHTLELAERLGLRHRPLDEAGLRADQDAVVITNANNDATTRAMGMIAPRGTIACLAPVLSRTIDTAAIIAHELRVLGIASGPIRPAIDWLAKEPTRLEGLLHELRPATSDLEASLRPPNSSALLRWAATITPATALQH